MRSSVRKGGGGGHRAEGWGVMCSCFRALIRTRGSGVLNVLEPLEALPGDPNEKCVTVVQPGGGKGVDKLSSRVLERPTSPRHRIQFQLFSVTVVSEWW